MSMNVRKPAKSFKDKMKEKETIQYVMDRYKAAYDKKDEYGIRENIKLFHEYWAGEQKPEDGISNTNVIQAIIESQVADLVKADIDVEAVGVEISDVPFAHDVEMVCDWVWEKNRMIPKLDDAERERLVQGTVGWRVYYDDEALRGKGLITIEHCGIETLFPDPKVTDPFKIQEGDFFIYTQVRPLSFLRRTFGERGKNVNSEGGYQFYDYRVIESTQSADKISSDQAVLFEFWEKDDDLNLRLIYCTQDTLLYDSTWDTEGSYLEHGKFPFVLVPCYKCKGRVWGKGDVEQLISPQDTINDLDDQIILNARQTANNQIAFDKSAMIDPKTWTNEPGLKIPMSNINGFKQIVPYPMPMYVIQRREKAFEETELVSGRPDVLEGRRSGSLRAASAIIALQEAGSRRGNHKALMQSEGISQVYELVVDNMKEFMTEEQAFRITNNDQVEYRWFRASDLREVPVLMPKTVVQPSTPDQTEPIISQELVELTDTSGNIMMKEAGFDLKITIGSGMPNNKSFMYQATIELFREGLVTQEEAREVLKRVLSWPVIDPYNPVGKFAGRNITPDTLGMMNGQPMDGSDPNQANQTNQIMEMLQQLGGQNGQVPMQNQGVMMPGQLPNDLANQISGLRGGIM